MMALYRSTGSYVKFIYAKHYNTLPIGFEHKTPETGLKLVALVLMVSNKSISIDFTIFASVKLLTPGDESNSTLRL